MPILPPKPLRDPHFAVKANDASYSEDPDKSACGRVDVLCSDKAEGREGTSSQPCDVSGLADTHPYHKPLFAQWATRETIRTNPGNFKHKPSRPVSLGGHSEMNENRDVRSMAGLNPFEQRSLDRLYQKLLAFCPASASLVICIVALVNGEVPWIFRVSAAVSGVLSFVLTVASLECLHHGMDHDASVRSKAQRLYYAALFFFVMTLLILVVANAIDSRSG